MCVCVNVIIAEQRKCTLSSSDKHGLADADGAQLYQTESHVAVCVCTCVCFVVCTCRRALVYERLFNACIDGCLHTSPAGVVSMPACNAVMFLLCSLFVQGGLEKGGVERGRSEGGR